MIADDMVSENDHARDLYTLSESIIPLWSQNIEEAKLLTNKSIEDLSLKFANLSQQVRHAINSDTHENSSQLVSLLQQSQEQLSSVIDLLKTSIDEKEALIGSISELAAKAKSLGNMADIVTRIANETGMVAVNAAIEAARVGERGRGFAVVADAVKRLSSDASRTASHISVTVNEVTKGIRKVEQHSQESAEQDAQTLANADKVVSLVLEQFGGMANKLVKASEAMLSDNRNVSQEIDQVIVSLQFQDRVSQMLSNVCLNMNELSALIANREDIGDTDEWLDTFRSKYVMQEQYDIHANQQHGHLSTSKIHKKTRSSPQPDLGDLTFF